MNEKSIYQEALNDMKVLKETAEQNAKHAILEAITPRLKDLIEKQLFESEEKEQSENPLLLDKSGDSDHACDGGPDCQCSECGSCTNESSEPDSEESDDYEVDECSSSVMENLSSFTNKGKFVQFSNSAQKLYDETNKVVNETNSYSVDSIDNLIDTSLSLYEYLQENFEQNRETQAWQTRLDRCYKVLNSVKGIKENKMRRKLVEEKEVTMKIKGLPDDVDLGTLSIDIMSDEEEQEMPDDGSAPPTDDASAPPPPPPPPATEAEDHMLELDESFIRRELARVRTKIEEAKRRKKKAPRTADPKSKHFGGGKLAKLRESDASSEVQEFLQLGDEIADARDADDQSDELESKVEIFNSMADQLGVDLGDYDLTDLDGWYEGSDGNRPLKPGNEEFCTWEAMLHYPEVGPLGEKMKRYLRRAVKAAGLSGEESVKQERTVYEDDLTTESRKRMVRKAIAESRKVSSSKVENSYKKVANRLSSELLETNLYNAKLIHTNKLLQLEGLTSVHKEYIIDRLDEAQNFGEVKRVYEGLLKKFVKSEEKKVQKIQESVSRSTSGSSSRPMRSGSMTQKKDTLNESIEAKEWARLAGLL